jgi:hypothetical protein
MAFNTAMVVLYASFKIISTGNRDYVVDKQQIFSGSVVRLADDCGGQPPQSKR